MRQKQIDHEQRAELAASQPAAAIEGVRPFTVKQGQYLAFIYYYSKIHGTPPAEADFQRYFRVTDAVLFERARVLLLLDGAVPGEPL